MFSIARNITMNPQQVSSKGGMPVPTGVSERDQIFSMNRKIIRRGWNGNMAKLVTSNVPHAATPFRAVNNASDVKPSACNPKYVYDSSVYSSYRNQVARNKSYNRLK